MKARILSLAGLSVAALGLIWIVAPRASAQSRDFSTWTFTTFVAPGSGVTRTEFRDMNPAGQIVGFYHQSGVIRGFLLHNGVFTPIVLGVSTEVRGINPQGDMVGITYPPVRGFLLSKGVVTQIHFAGATRTLAADIDANGDIVGDYTLAGQQRGYLYRDGAFTTIHVPGSLVTTARGINPEGEIVGIYGAVDPDGATRGHGFLLGKDGSFTTIDGQGVPPNGNTSGISPRGEIVGDYSPVFGAAPRLGFVLGQGEYTTFSCPGASITRPWKITPDGQHIVGACNDQYGFVLSRKP